MKRKADHLQLLSDGKLPRLTQKQYETLQDVRNNRWAWEDANPRTYRSLQLHFLVQEDRKGSFLTGRGEQVLAAWEKHQQAKNGTSEEKL